MLTSPLLVRVSNRAHLALTPTAPPPPTPGRHLVASVYAPISYGPLPLLAFKCAPGRQPVLAATGGLRSVDPDRVVLKKIVLTGYPAR